MGTRAAGKSILTSANGDEDCIRLWTNTTEYAMELLLLWGNLNDSLTFPQKMYSTGWLRWEGNASRVINRKVVRTIAYVGSFDRLY
jgi:hypothetical protein